MQLVHAARTTVVSSCWALLASLVSRIASRGSPVTLTVSLGGAPAWMVNGIVSVVDAPANRSPVQVTTALALDATQLNPSDAAKVPRVTPVVGRSARMTTWLP